MTFSNLRYQLAEDGIATVCFGTGMAAISATTLTLLRQGDHVVSSAFLFGNTNSFFGTLATFGINTTFVDATDVANVAAALEPNTRAVFVETIANPATQVVDLAGIGELCREKGLLYIVDNTMTSPWLFKPRDVGASLVVNALTKYIGGHGNALAGAITDTGLYDWTRYPNIYDIYKSVDPAHWGIQQIRKKGLRDMGGSLGPEAAHHISVGADTLGLRMDRSCDNALAIAQFCNTHPKVAKVFYPGLESHPQHARAQKLFRKSGALLSIELAAGVDGRWPGGRGGCQCGERRTLGQADSVITQGRLVARAAVGAVAGHVDERALPEQGHAEVLGVERQVDGFAHLLDAGYLDHLDGRRGGGRRAQQEDEGAEHARRSRGWRRMASPARPGPWGRRWGATPFPSWCPAIGCSPPAAGSAVSWAARMIFH